MPELPELQAHAERLGADWGGRVLERFRTLSFTALKTYAPAPETAVGHRLAGVGRRGKYLTLDFEVCTFVVHLMQGGRLRPDTKQSAKPRGGLARWVFDDHSALLLTEAGTEKRAGVWVLENADDEVEPFAGLGPDADQVDRNQLATMVAGSSARLHGWLRDQHQIAGLGRRLANEICHRARLSPFSAVGKLDEEQLDRLHQAIVTSLELSLAYERGRDDMSSSKERPSEVHHRTGEPCPVCGDVVRSVEYASYTINYCATCQTGGKVLADNTTSKFLK